MALEFWFTDMSDEARENENYCWQGTDKDGQQVAPVTHSIIFACMTVGIGRITDKNVGEFYARMRVLYLLESVGGLYENGKPRMITMKELNDHVGLFTNVGNETRAQWARRLFVNQRTSIIETEMHGFNRWRGNKLAEELGLT